MRRAGATEDFEAAVKDMSELGLAMEASGPLRAGETVVVSGVLVNGLTQVKLQRRPAKVARCREIRAGCYAIGLTYSEEAAPAEAPDYYEMLQLSPNADPETIHRVYRLLAQRFHPDNMETGDQAQFKILLEAYRVLSDPEKRAAYDATLGRARQLRWKIFDRSDAAQGREGERRKRAGILALLYAQRMNQPHQPALGLHEMEDLLGCPREHLEFPLWYLKEAALVTRTDNGKYAITAKGVDRSEAEEEAGRSNGRLLAEAGRSRAG